MAEDKYAQLRQIVSWSTNDYELKWGNINLPITSLIRDLLAERDALAKEKNDSPTGNGYGGGGCGD